MMPHTLIAGVGNVFLGDDGFGVEVVSRLSQEAMPPGVRVLDAGIRTRHLAYELLDGEYRTVILADAVVRGGTPGTVYLIEPEVAADLPNPGLALDGHAIDAEHMLALVRKLGGAPARILIVGCEPASIDDGMGLTPPVAAAVDEALAVVRRLVCA